MLSPDYQREYVWTEKEVKLMKREEEILTAPNGAK